MCSDYLLINNLYVYVVILIMSLPASIGCYPNSRDNGDECADNDPML